MRVLITGGAGFVGSHLAMALQERSGNQIVVLDNLRRRGSELNLPVLRSRGIQFIHGDIRETDDLADLPGNFDLMIEASAEPSVHAGQHGSPAYVISTNLKGTLNCLEFARKNAGAFLYLSTSRVYSIQPLREIALVEAPDRFEISPQQTLTGISDFGIAEGFPTDQARSMYGATKLASELMIQEYVQVYGLKAVINRCGVIAGPGQFGKVDQGVVSLWVACHHFGWPLKYTGFGGAGKQVRDLLHPADLFDLMEKQIEQVGRWRGEVFNVGGGRPVSVSLRELTALCCQTLGRSTSVEAHPDTAPVDIPLYVTDYRKAARSFAWQPCRGAGTIVSEIAGWIQANEEALKPIFGMRASGG